MLQVDVNLYHRGTIFSPKDGNKAVFVLVPSHLGDIFSADRLTKSLKTKCPKVARERFPVAVREIHQKFYNAEAIKARPELFQIFQEARDKGLKIKDLPVTQADWERLLGDIEAAKQAKWSPIIKGPNKEDNEYRLEFEHLWVRMADVEDIASGKTPPLSMGLCETMLAARHAQPDYSDSNRSDFESPWKFRLSMLKRARTTHSQVMQEVSVVLNEKDRDEHDMKFSEACNIALGHQKLSKVSTHLKAIVRDHGDFFLSELNGDLLRSIASKMHDKGAANNTITDRVNFPIRVIEILHDHGKIPINKFCVQRIDTKRYGAPKQSRDPFSLEEVVSVAKLIQESDKKHKEGLLLLWQSVASTGMRLGEAVQLRKTHIKQVNGELCFDLMTDGYEVKTESSRRYVAIPEIFKNHLLDRIEKFPADRLFPFLPVQEKDGQPDWSHHASKMLNPFVAQVRKGNKRKVVHSLRNTFAHQLKNLEGDPCPTDIRKDILGHKDESTHRGYSGGTAVNIMKSWVDKLAYPWLEIDTPPDTAERITPE